MQWSGVSTIDRFQESLQTSQEGGFLQWLYGVWYQHEDSRVNQNCFKRKLQ